MRFLERIFVYLVIMAMVHIGIYVAVFKYKGYSDITIDFQKGYVCAKDVDNFVLCDSIWKIHLGILDLEKNKGV